MRARVTRDPPKHRVAGRTLVVALVDGLELRVPVRWLLWPAAGTAAQLASLRNTEGSQPLAGRMLFDESSFPPAARPYR